MDAIQLLKQDHDKVDQIFMQFEQGGDSQRFNQLFLQLFQELSVHAIAEEQVLYPELAKFNATAPKAKDAYKEHAEMKASLGELAALDNTSEEWSRKINKLRTDVQHHVREEEGEVFPALRQVMSEAQLQDLGQKIMQVKQTELSSPSMQIPMQRLQQTLGTMGTMGSTMGTMGSTTMGNMGGTMGSTMNNPL